MALCGEISAFKRAKAGAAAHARQVAALFHIAGIDLGDALAMPAPERTRIAARLRRLVERERQRGMQRHWSYDLNRHIALKQALDRLCAPTG